MTQLRRIIVGHNFYPDGEVAVRSAAADLIVIGTHGRTGLAHILLGSVAERVVRTAACSVLTVRPDGFRFELP